MLLFTELRAQSETNMLQQMKNSTHSYSASRIYSLPVHAYGGILDLVGSIV